MSDERRFRRQDERIELRQRMNNARKRLEKLDAHMFFDERGIVSNDEHQDRLSANAVELAEAVRDALDILNHLPEGYWRKHPTEYVIKMKLEDL